MIRWQIATGEEAQPMMAVTIDEHPCLEVATRAIDLERPLADLPSPPALLELLREDAPAPFHSSEAVRTASVA